MAIILTPEQRAAAIAASTKILELFQKAEADGRLSKDDDAPGAAPLAMAEQPPCPHCGSGRSMKMGSHAGTDHYVCRNCGEDHEFRPPAPAPQGAPVQKSLAAGSPDVAPGQKVGGAALGKAWRAGGPPPKTGSLAPKPAPTPPPAKPLGKAYPSVARALRLTAADKKAAAPKPAPAPQPTTKAETHGYVPKRPGATSGCKTCGEAPGHGFHTGPKGPPQKPAAPTQKAEPVAKAIPSIGHHLRLAAADKAKAQPAPAAPAAAPVAKASPPPVPEAAAPHDQRQGPKTVGTAIPPRIPGSAAIGGARQLLPPKLPGMTPRKAEPPVQAPADHAAVAHANRQLQHFKPIATSPTAMPQHPGSMFKMDSCLKCAKSECNGGC